MWLIAFIFIIVLVQGFFLIESTNKALGIVLMMVTIAAVAAILFGSKKAR